MTIKLLRKLVISNQNDARQYQLQELYLEYFEQLNSFLDFLEIPEASTMIMQLQASTDLHNMFILRFTHVLTENNPFLDLNGEAIEIESIKLVCKTFTRNAPNPVLFIMLTSNPMAVVDIHNETRVLKNPNTADGEPLLTVLLDNNTRIDTRDE
jgi:hypothetical protein